VLLSSGRLGSILTETDSNREIPRRGDPWRSPWRGSSPTISPEIH